MARADHPTPRRPGPRTRGPAVSEQLLDATAELLAERSPGDLSIRLIARRAGVSPAMVSYHFGGKEGLLAAVLDRAAAEMVGRLESSVEEADPSRRLRTVLEEITATVSRSPWLPGLLVRTVLLEAGPSRERFLSHFAPRLAGLLLGLIEEGIELGRLRDDLDPRLVFLSFLGMTVYPFIARPLVEPLLGVTYDERFRRRFTTHTERLLLEGIGGTRDVEE